MDLSFSEEQVLLRDSVRRWVRNAYGFDVRRQSLESGGSFRSDVWRQMADAGWLAVGIPEANDGLGGGTVEYSVICEELGRGLVLEPYVASAVFATQLIALIGSDTQKADWLPALAAGQCMAAVAYSEPQARGAPGHVAATATPDRGGYRIYGRKTLVLGAPLADLLLVSARSPEGISLFALDAGTPGLQFQQGLLVDGRRSADLVLDGVEVPASRMLGTAGSALPALELALDHAIVASCAESLGIMEQCLDMSADYVKTRKQFGVPIGSFQALQHRLADMAIEIEMARSMHVHALRAMALADPAERQRGVGASKAFISQKAKWVTGQAIQLHGGIGMTEEFLVGHYFKRAVVSEVLYGTSDLHLNRCADALQTEIRGLVAPGVSAGT